MPEDSASFSVPQAAELMALARAGGPRAALAARRSAWLAERNDPALAREALALAPLDVHTMNAIADTLLRLGRIGEAIEVLEFAVEVAPTDRRAHQLLGAGYTDMNYTELYAAFPQAFADDSGQQRLAQADAALNARQGWLSLDGLFEL